MDFRFQNELYFPEDFLKANMCEYKLSPSLSCRTVVMMFCVSTFTSDDRNPSGITLFYCVENKTCLWRFLAICLGMSRACPLPAGHHRFLVLPLEGLRMKSSLFFLPLKKGPSLSCFALLVTFSAGENVLCFCCRNPLFLSADLSSTCVPDLVQREACL